MLSPKAINNPSRTSTVPGSLNLVVNSESRTIMDQCDWMINPKKFQQIQQSLGPLQTNLFASGLTEQLSHYYSWKAEATDAFNQNWAQPRGFVNPLWCLFSWHLNQIKQYTRVLLVTSLWPYWSWFPIILGLLEDNPRQIPHIQDIILNPTNHEFIRKQGVQCWPHGLSVSAQASELLLSSWQSNSNSSYNSLFSKWASWCEWRNRDPTVGPVEDVVDFPAELHAEGYQYRSLTAYRSAISSIHKWVEGQSIGQHPMVLHPLKGAFNQNTPTPIIFRMWG